MLYLLFKLLLIISVRCSKTRLLANGRIMHACGERTIKQCEWNRTRNLFLMFVYVCNQFWINAEPYLLCFSSEMSALLCVSSAIMPLPRKPISTCTFEHILERNLSSATSVARRFAHKVTFPLPSKWFNCDHLDFQFIFKMESMQFLYYFCIINQMFADCVSSESGQTPPHTHRRAAI